ncbi:hypothetical protein CK203_114967 [Vitis vinifera]|uniref:Uncharacterized protein n=1 Tax=Vitis vinifera TaxID=29760 RepID=A0A438E0D0_VITVI|nr:hypothetical protein CK203_114967 [Vitis vinifera]
MLQKDRSTSSDERFKRDYVHAALLVKKAKQWENKSTNPSKGGKSAKIPPQRGQVKVKIFELVAGQWPPKTARQECKPAQMKVAMVAEATAVAAVVAEPTNYARILDETKELRSKS